MIVIAALEGSDAVADSSDAVADSSDAVADGLTDLLVQVF